MSMYKSCVAPSSSGYSHTHACSASSNRDGCCRLVGGIRISSKKPSVTESNTETYRCGSIQSANFESVRSNGNYVNRLNEHYHKLLPGYSFGFCRLQCRPFSAETQCTGIGFPCVTPHRPAVLSSRPLWLYLEERCTGRRSEEPVNGCRWERWFCCHRWTKCFFRFSDGLPCWPASDWSRLWWHRSISCGTFRAESEWCPSIRLTWTFSTRNKPNPIHGTTKHSKQMKPGYLRCVRQLTAIFQ